MSLTEIDNNGNVKNNVEKHDVRKSEKNDTALNENIDKVNEKISKLELDEEKLTFCNACKREIDQTNDEDEDSNVAGRF